MARELPLRVAVYGDRTDSKSAHEHGRGLHGGPVGAVHADCEPCGPYRSDIDLRHDGIDILLGRIQDMADGADGIPADAPDVAVIRILYPLLLLMGAFRPVAGDAFDAVVLRGIVGCSNHDSAGDPGAHLHIMLERGCRDHPEVDHIRTHGDESGADGVPDHAGRRPCVIGESHRRAEHGPDALPHAQCQFAAEAVVRDPAHAVGSEHPHVISSESGPGNHLCHDRCCAGCLTMSSPGASAPRRACPPPCCTPS